MGVNIGAIAGKLKRYTESGVGKQKMATAIQRIMNGSGPTGKKGVTQAGDVVVTYEQMQQAAKELIAIVRRHAASAGLPASVMAHVESFYDSPLVKKEDGSATIEINMLDSAHRDSVQPERYRGSDNIVAAFNAGYDADGVTYGYWKSRDMRIRTRQHREGSFFLQSAVDEFNAKYGEKYNVTVTLNSQYNEDS